jgi:hypothetical protein
MPKLINWELLKQPYNWVIVFLMCVVALVFLSLVFPESSSAGSST